MIVTETVSIWKQTESTVAAAELPVIRVMYALTVSVRFLVRMALLTAIISV